jgi:LacI family transcriptional regulator
VRVRIADLGRSALEQLAAMLEDPQRAMSSHTLGCEIVARATCGSGQHRNKQVF